MRSAQDRNQRFHTQSIDSEAIDSEAIDSEAIDPRSIDPEVPFQRHKRIEAAWKPSSS